MCDAHCDDVTDEEQRRRLRRDAETARNLGLHDLAATLESEAERDG